LTKVVQFHSEQVRTHIAKFDAYSNLAISLHRPTGGYVLIRPPSKINLGVAERVTTGVITLWVILQFKSQKYSI